MSDGQTHYAHYKKGIKTFPFITLVEDVIEFARKVVKHNG